METRKYNPETDGTWIVTIDNQGRWHTHSRWGIQSAETGAISEKRNPNIIEAWAIGAITRSQALSIAKRDFSSRQIKRSKDEC